jgi:hypothetical protein
MVHLSYGAWFATLSCLSIVTASRGSLQLAKLHNGQLERRTAHKQVPEAIKKDKVDLIKTEMELQMQGLNKLRGSADDAVKEVRRTDAINDNRTFILGEVLSLSEAIPTALANAPQEMADAMAEIPLVTPPPGLDATQTEQFEAAAKAAREALVARTSQLTSILTERVANATSVLKEKIAVLEDVRKTDRKVVDDITKKVQTVRQGINDQILAIGQTKDKFVASEVDGGKEDLLDAVGELKFDYSRIKESVKGDKFNEMTGTGLSNVRQDISSWKRKKEKVRDEILRYKKLKAKAAEMDKEVAAKKAR